MALMRCPECGREVSNRATSCVSCGNPLAQGLRPVDSRSVITIEKRGKSLKLQGILAPLLLLAGIILIWIGNKSAAADAWKLVVYGAIAVLVGMAWIVYVKILTWWRHS